MVLTEGDHFADMVASKGLGIAVPAGDVDALVHALDTALFDSSARARYLTALESAREEYRWSTVLMPLVSHIEQLDPSGLTQRRSRPVRFSPARPRPPRFSFHDLGRGFQRLFRGEFRSLTRAVLRKLRPRR